MLDCEPVYIWSLCSCICILDIICKRAYFLCVQHAPALLRLAACASRALHHNFEAVTRSTHIIYKTNAMYISYGC